MLDTLEVENYVNTLSEVTGLPVGEIEHIINTQVAMILGDLAILKESNTWMGKVYMKEGVLTIKPNNILQGVLDNKIDPLFVLKEIAQHE